MTATRALCRCTDFQGWTWSCTCSAHTQTSALQQHGHRTSLARRDTSANQERAPFVMGWLHTRTHRPTRHSTSWGKGSTTTMERKKKKGFLGLAPRLQTLLEWLLSVPPQAAGCANFVTTFPGKTALLVLRKLPQDRSKNTFQASIVLKPTRAVPDVRHCSAELHANGGVQKPLKAASRHD